MKKFKLLLSCVMIVGLFSTVAFAADLATVTNSPGVIDTYEINNMTPGSSKTFLGTRLRGLLQNETASVTATGSVDLDVEDAVIRFVSGASGVGTFDATYGNGQSGQLTTFVLVTDGGGEVTVTPSTKTGFTSIALTDAKDACTLRYQDDTVGWVVAGNNGCTVN